MVQLLMLCEMIMSINKTSGGFFSRFKLPLEILTYLSILTAFFCFVELSFFICCNGLYLSDFKFMTEHMALPWSILPAIIYFIFAQLLVHFTYVLLVLYLTLTFAKAFQWAESRVLPYAIYIWLIGMAVVIAANQAFLPNSKFAGLSAVILNTEIAEVLAYVGAFIFALSFAFALFLSVMRLSARALVSVVSVLILVTLTIQLKVNSTLDVQNASTKDKPNIILIGVDSLRPDFVGFFGSSIPTPFIDNFLQSSTVFSEAVTPLARTFPSWTAILTGQHPKMSGIRSNLERQDQMDVSVTLANHLRQDGYKTIYATDETRFSNIDQHYGFDEVVTPPIGVNDFLLGTFNDFPLSNLLINTKVGQWLFPYSYANRPVYFAYQPNSFLSLIQPLIMQQRTKPLFLTIHFCLSHHPYVWGSLAGKNKTTLELYQQSIERVDQQLRDFYVLLQQAQLLDNTVVVLLSDHGEAIELSGDRITEESLFVGKKTKHTLTFYPPSLENEAVNESVGHGTDVLGLTQYHSLLAFRYFGSATFQPRTVPGVVSLIDIKPTILDLIEKTHTTNSLLGVLKDSHQTINSKRHLFTESDFSPAAIRTVYPETRKVLLEGFELFQIDPMTTRLVVKDQMLNMIIQSKQYADIYDHWMLALYPEKQHTRVPILVNLDTGLWTNDLNSPYAKTAPAKLMLAALRKFYAAEIGADNIRSN